MLEDDAIFGAGRRIVLSGAKIAERGAEIDYFRRQHGHCVAKFRGIDSIADAEKFVGAEIKIPAGELPAPREGWYYTFELKGCDVFTGNGEYVGSLTAVLDWGGSRILKVDRENEETLIPFAQSFLRRIDLDQRRIEVDLPEDLRDLNK